MDKIFEAMKALKVAETEARGLPHLGYMTEDFSKTLQEQCTVEDTSIKLTAGAMGAFQGIPMKISHVLPKGVMAMFINAAGIPIAILHDDTYEPTPEPKTTKNIVEEMFRDCAPEVNFVDATPTDN